MPDFISIMDQLEDIFMSARWKILVPNTTTWIAAGLSKPW